MRPSIEVLERLLQGRMTRVGVALAAETSAIGARLVLRNKYLALSSLLRGWRALEHVPPGYVPARLIKDSRRVLEGFQDQSYRSLYHEGFQSTTRAKRIRAEFAEYPLRDRVGLRLPREDGDEARQGDLIILKPALDSGEKGVILVKYSPSFASCAAVFNLEQLSSRYRFVLEPSTWGYQDPDLLLYLNLPTDVIVQSQYAPDFEFIKSLGQNFIPVEVGAGDWVDPNSFSSGNDDEKRFDVVMVASWQRLKRHYLLFRALRELGQKVRRVALVGSPYNGSTRDEVEAEAQAEGVLEKISWFESIPHWQVAEILSQSRVSVVLSTREGASKILYESLFCNVPVIISKSNIGINRRHINNLTGVFASDENLSRAIGRVLLDNKKFAPRRWALENTGYAHSTCVIQKVLKDRALESGEPWTLDLLPKMNAPNPRYVDHEHWRGAQRWYGDLVSFLR